jgi:hypothetical protein
MPLRLFSDETGWDLARKGVRYTAAALRTESAHAALVKPLVSLLTEWTTIDQARRDADDALTDRHAQVGALDARLDQAVVNLHARLVSDCGGDRKHKTVQRYFPEPMSDVVHMGLEVEILRVQRFHDVAKELGASKQVQAILGEIAAIQDNGKTVLDQRREAAAEVGRVSLRMHTWKESANSARRGIESALEAYAVANELPRTYADDFFPVAVKKRVVGKRSDVREM